MNKKKRRAFPGIPFVDFFLLLVVFSFYILRVAILQINAESQAGTVKPISTDTLFMIVVTWDGDLDDDVDTWVADPNGNLVGYTRPQGGFMHLERDDTGALHSERVVLPDGRVTHSAINEERIDIRGFMKNGQLSIIPGEYIVNLFMYRKASPQPVKVTVTLYKVKEGLNLVQKVVELSQNGEEKTAFRFTITDDGNVVDINALPKKIAQPYSGSDEGGH